MCTGFAIVVVAADGSLAAYGSGVPPWWCMSAAATEAWALYTALAQCPFMPALRTDCLGLLSTAEGGTARATAADKPLARAWVGIAATLDGDITQLVRRRRLVWLPAHQSATAIGNRTLSNGKEMTALDWRANRLVDALAKMAAAVGRMPKALSRLLDSGKAACRHAAALLGVVTHAANNCHVQEQREDGTLVTRIKRDAQQPARRPRRSVPAAAEVCPPLPLLGDLEPCASVPGSMPGIASRQKRKCELGDHIGAKRLRAIRLGRSRAAAEQLACTRQLVESIGSRAAAPMLQQSVAARLQGVHERVRARLELSTP
jgi:hypothetical protein